MRACPVANLLLCASLVQNLEKPDEEEVERVARETAAALSLRVDKKQAAVNPKTLPTQPGAAQYIKV